MKLRRHPKPPARCHNCAVLERRLKAAEVSIARVKEQRNDNAETIRSLLDEKATRRGAP